MLVDYFHRTEADADFYARRLAPRLPGRILDIHTHINRWEHVADVPAERIADDWALQTGLHMTAEDGAHYFRTLFPDRAYSFVAFPFPIREAHLEANNAYIAECVRDGRIYAGLICVRPGDDLEELERSLTEWPVAGIKPYPDLVSGHKGSEVSIFEFLPESQLALAERLDRIVMLHLPRAGRMPDPENVRELRRIRQRYPDLRICIAHLGRCFTPRFFAEAMRELGEDRNGFWFDTAAVINPDVHRLAFKHLPLDRILYGSDQPIFLWHGRRRWTETTYQNLAREDFAWNRHSESPEQESAYTFYVYEQIANLLDVMADAGFGPAEADAVFAANAEQLLSGAIQGVG